jgi:hypothetical protein
MFLINANVSTKIVEIIVHINKSAVFDPYMKHKKSAPACSFAAGALLISSRNFPGGEPVIDVCCFVAKSLPNNLPLHRDRYFLPRQKCPLNGAIQAKVGRR